jgi:hypothetical protein
MVSLTKIPRSRISQFFFPQRAAQIHPKPKSSSSATSSPQDPALSLLRNGHSIDVGLLTTQNLETTRQQLQQQLTDKEIPFIYLHQPEDIARFLDDLTLNAHGAPQKQPGPLRKLLNNGGVLIVNEQNFSPAQLETLNEIKEGHRFQGQDIHPSTSVLSLIENHKPKKIS